MQIRVNNDSVEIEGYVNAIERFSKPLRSRLGNFIERVKKGAFKRAIERNDNIRLLLNHNWDRDLGGTADGNLELIEDNIGLKARATITDPEVIKKARNGDLVGWSFGFEDRDVDEDRDSSGMKTRDIKDMDLYEVSLIDRRKTPAYEGTLVTVRADETYYHGETLITEEEIKIEVREDNNSLEQSKTVEDKVIDYSKYDALIAEMKEDKYNV